MMKKGLVLLFALVMFLGIAGNASAVTYTDTFDAGGLYMEDGHWQYTGGWWGSWYYVSDDTIGWTFDITDDGYNPSSETVTDASIILNFSDDSCDWCDWYEYANLEVGSNIFNWEVDSGNRTFSLYSLVTLSDTGMVDAQLTATGGDFFFNYATLDVSAVPEPATLLLLGSGLAGLVFYRRKRK